MARHKKSSLVQVSRETTAFGESGYNIYLFGHLIAREWNSSPATVRQSTRTMEADVRKQLIKLGWTPPK